MSVASRFAWSLRLGVGSLYEKHAKAVCGNDLVAAAVQGDAVEVLPAEA